MKRIVLFLAAITWSCTTLFAQETTDETPKTEVKHYFNLGFKLGYSALPEFKSPLENQLLGGAGGGLGLTYELEYGHFLFDAGIEADYLTSLTRYNFQAERPLAQPYSMIYNYRFLGWNEQRSGLAVGVPVMVGAQFGNVYFLVGGKVAYGLMGNAKHYGQYDVTAYDPALAGPIGGDEHGLGLHTMDKGSSPAAVLPLTPLDARVMLEVGYDLDPWLQKPAGGRRKTGGRKPNNNSKYLPFTPHDVHYRVALFAEYGLMNTNTAAASESLVRFGDASKVEATGFESMLNYQDATGARASVNNLFVGAKFTIQFNVFNKRPVKPVIPPSYFTLKIQDENGNPAMAKVEVRNDDKQKTIVAPKDINKKGIMRRKYALGNYTAIIAKADYYADTIHFSVTENGSNDSLIVHLRPLPKIEQIVEVPVEEVVGQVFVLHNMFFATNQTAILPESEEALKTLYDFLTANPTTRIRIIGHTDSVGKDAANQTLSEGRAAAVKAALIERGIDPARLESEGRGESEPIADNETEEGRAQNRRVEIEVLE